MRLEELMNQYSDRLSETDLIFGIMWRNIKNNVKI